MLPSKHSVSEMLDWSPDALAAWVRQHRAAIDGREDWKELAYGCSSKAACDSDLNDNELIAWGTAALLIYDRLRDISEKPSERSDFATTGMSLRAFIINKLGAESGHLVKDPAILEDWFFQELDLLYGEAFLMAKEAQKLSTRDFLHIASLKDRVRIMKSVLPQEAFSRKDELEQWYGLLDIALG